MKKLVIILLVFILVVGCKAGEEVKTYGAFIGGTDGLSIDFVENEPPARVLDNRQENFYIALRLENKGEFTIPSEKVIASIKGISKDAFSMTDLNVRLSNELEGQFLSGGAVIKGGIDDLQFSQASYIYDLNADFSTDLRVDVCYNYRTQGLIPICLKRDAVQRKVGDDCVVNNNNIDFDTSGAPVQIKNVKEASSGSHEIKLTFDIDNVGDGEVYASDAFSDSCFSDETKKDKMTVVLESTGGYLPIQCSRLGGSNKGDLKLIDNRRTVVCRIDTNDLQEAAFEEPLNLNLYYFYKEGLSKSLTVENTG